MYPAKIPSQEEVLQAFRRAGFATLTPLQEKLIPAMLRGRDVAAEAAAGSGRTVGFVLPLIVGLRGAGPAPQALVLCGAAEDVGKVARAAARAARAVRDAPVVVPLGEIEDARREQRRLEKGATIVVGTTERVIDHVRRGSLVFDHLATTVVTAPEGPALADFVKDVQFIFAKIAERRQTILFSHAPLTEENQLLQLLRHPILLGGAEQESAEPAGTGHLYIPIDAGRAEDRSSLLSRVILGMRMPSTVVYHSPRTDARKVAEGLERSGLRAALLSSGPSGARGQTDRRSAVLDFSSRALDVLLVPLGAGPGTPELQEASPSHVVFYEGGGSRPAPGRVRPGAVVIALVDQGQEKDVARLQEAIGVTMSRGQIPSDDEVLTGAIDRIVKRIGEEDRAELAWLRSRIRRQVPLLLRPFFMASLLKAQLPPLTRPAPLQKPGAAEQPRPVQPRAGQARPGQPRAGLARPAETTPSPRGRFGRITAAGPAATRPPRPEARAEIRGDGQFAQLFVSIGRNRRVYARDLSALFTEKLALAAGDIGGVRVFEKYSFVDIVPSRAEEAIAKLSGTELKGRTITVNYAKKKEGKEGS